MMRHKRWPLPVGLILFATILVGTPVLAGDVFVFYSLANRDLWDSLEPALSSYQIETYKVDLLALGDYSTKQKALARAARCDVSIVVGPNASRILSGSAVANPVIAVEARHDLQSKAQTTIYLYSDKRPPVLIVPQKVQSAGDIKNLALQEVTSFEVDAGVDIGEVLAALVERVAPGRAARE